MKTKDRKTQCPNRKQTYSSLVFDIFAESNAILQEIADFTRQTVRPIRLLTGFIVHATTRICEAGSAGPKAPRDLRAALTSGVFLAFPAPSFWGIVFGGSYK